MTAQVEGRRAVNHDGQAIAFDSVGSGAPLLLISGFGYPRAMWFRMLPQLASRCRVVTFDNRGVGSSDVPQTPWTVTDMARDALAVLDETGCDRTHVLGCSMGGVIALELALLAPERVASLVLACTGLHSAERPRIAEPPRMTDDDARMFQRAGHSRLYGVRANPELVEEDLHRLLEVPLTGAGVRGQALAMRDHIATAEQARGLSARTLVVHGDQDRVTPLAWGVELADLIPAAELHVVTGAGHALATEAADELADVAVRFMGGAAADLHAADSPGARGVG